MKHKYGAVMNRKNVVIAVLIAVFVGLVIYAGESQESQLNCVGTDQQTVRCVDRVSKQTLYLTQSSFIDRKLTKVPVDKTVSCNRSLNNYQCNIHGRVFFKQFD